LQPKGTLFHSRRRGGPTGTNEGVNAWNPKRRNAHGRRRKAKTGRFSSYTEEKKIVKNDGKTIADASDKKVAEDVAERLNAEEDLREQDRWSA
jgi:hypothetical protein